MIVDRAKTPQGRDNNPEYVRARWISNMFNKYEDYYRMEMKRLVRNQKMAWGINFGQWPSFVVEKMKRQGRRPPTFNIIGKKIETRVGQFLDNGFDIKYMPPNGQYDQWSLNLRELYLNDKKNLMWTMSNAVALRDFNIMYGAERIIISDKYDSRGNIAWEPLNPYHMYLDTSWKSYDSDDIDLYFEWGMLYASEMCEIFPKVSEKIKDLRDREHREGYDLGEYNGGPNVYREVEHKWGDRHKVIWLHYVKKEERLWEYDLKNRCPFPETGFKYGSEEDRAIKMDYILANRLRKEDITWDKQKRKVKYVEAVCPTIDAELFLTSGKDRVQTNNCNIHPLGNFLYGQAKATVDDLYDVQISFNKGEMCIDDIQVRSAKGAFVLDKALAGGDERLQAEIEQHWNEPGARIWVDEGATANLGRHGGIIKLQDERVSDDLFRQNDRRLNLADWLSVPAAASARTEQNQESGKLYNLKMTMGLIGEKYAMEIWKTQEIGKARSYKRQVPITYAGWPREFGSKDGKPIILNQRKVDSYGRRSIINDVSKIPDMAVSLVPHPQGANVRTELGAQYRESLEILKQHPDAKLALLVILHAMYDTVPMPEEKKTEVDKAMHILKQNAALEQALANLEMRAQLIAKTANMQKAGIPSAGRGEQGGGQIEQHEETEQDRQSIHQGTPAQTVGG